MVAWVAKLMRLLLNMAMHQSNPCATKQLRVCSKVPGQRETARRMWFSINSAHAWQLQPTKEMRSLKVVAPIKSGVTQPLCLGPKLMRKCNGSGQLEER